MKFSVFVKFFLRFVFEQLVSIRCKYIEKNQDGEVNIGAGL